MVQETNTEQSASSNKPDPSADDLKYVTELMSTGKRHYVCDEPQLALNCFVKLCEKLADLYGQTADECAEAYLYYGKTLLDIARIENGVLGLAVKDAPVLGEQTEEEGDENIVSNDTNDFIVPDNPELSSAEKDNIKEEVEHSLRDGNHYNDTDDEQTEEEEVKGEEKEEGASSCVKAAKEISIDKNGLVKTPPVGVAGGIGQVNSDVEQDIEEVTEQSGDGEEEEDVTNMQLSWEMFELTCLICNRQLKRGNRARDDVKRLLAEAKYGLAQISLESEHYEEAVKDFTECLNLYTEVFEDKEDRKIAEVYYNIGLALSFDKRFSEAIVNYQKAVVVLQARLKTLEKNISECEGKDNVDNLEEWKKESSELKDLLLLDMMAKIEDATEMLKQSEASIKEMKQVAKEMFSGLLDSNEQGFDKGFDAPSDEKAMVVNDLTEKVRSVKRKSCNEDAVCKKVKKCDENDVATSTVTQTTNDR